MKVYLRDLLVEYLSAVLSKVNGKRVGKIFFGVSQGSQLLKLRTVSVFKIIAKVTQLKTTYSKVQDLDLTFSPPLLS